MDFHTRGLGIPVMFVLQVLYLDIILEIIQNTFLSRIFYIYLIPDVCVIFQMFTLLGRPSQDQHRSKHGAETTQWNKRGACT